MKYEELKDTTEDEDLLYAILTLISKDNNN